MTTALDIDRFEAARLLREARAAVGDARREAAGWAGAAMPDRRVASRILIDALLDADEIDEASSVLERARQAFPNDASLLLRQARCLLALGRLEEAWRAAHAAARLRHGHVGTLLTAAAIARDVGRPAKAGRLLERAARLRTDDPAVIDALVQVRLDVGDVIGARAAMTRYPAVGAGTCGRVLLAEGRIADAIELLSGPTDAPADGETVAEADDRTCVLIDALERCGAAARLRSLLAGLTPEMPEAYTRAIDARLVLGELDEAIAMAGTLAHRPGCRRRALHRQAVAAALAGRTSLARGALSRLRSTSGSVDRSALAATWRRALEGRITTRQATPRRAGADEGHGVLASLLRNAISTFDRSIGTAGTDARPDLVALRAAGITALGRSAADAVLMPAGSSQRSRPGDLPLP